jgi:type IV secretion system protein TrbJ
MRNQVFWGTAVIAAVILVQPAQAQFINGVYCFNCSTEPTALNTSIIQDLQRAEQVLQYGVELQQLANMIQNTLHRGQATLTNVSMDLNQLANVVQGGQALAYSLGNQDKVFAQTYPGYQPPPGAPPGGFETKYALWAQTSLATTQGLLRGVGVQGKLLATEQGVLSILRTLSASNLLNRNDAINLTGQLAAEQVGQLQKLRELQLEDMTSKAAFQGYTIQKDAASMQAVQDALQHVDYAADPTSY